MYKIIFGQSSNTENCCKVPKKDFMIVLPYFAKHSLQISTRINRVRKNKLHHCNLRIVFQIKCKLINFLKLVKFMFSYVLALFINLTVVPAMLPIITKLSVILKSECVNNLEVLLLLETVKGNNDSAIKEHHLSRKHSSDFEAFPY